MSDVRLMYMTCADHEQALAIVRPLLNDKVIACANILPGMTACYRWQGVIEEASEVVVIMKTHVQRVDEAMRRLAALHPYETPCIVVLPIDGAYGPFAAWVRDSTGG